MNLEFDTVPTPAASDATLHPHLGLAGLVMVKIGQSLMPDEELAYAIRHDPSQRCSRLRLMHGDVQSVINISRNAGSNYLTISRPRERLGLLKRITICAKMKEASGTHH